MKVIKCEMCGVTKFAKEGDFFVCQGCGTKYSTEDAKKMMVEVEDEVKKTIPEPVENAVPPESEKLKNLRTLARRAKENNDAANAAKYYEMILLEDPNDWESAFYSIYYANMEITNGEIANSVTKVYNCLDNVKALVLALNGDAKRAAIMEVADKLETICNFYTIASVNYFPKVVGHLVSSFTYHSTLKGISDIAFFWADMMYDIAGGDSTFDIAEKDEEMKKKAISLYKTGISAPEQTVYFTVKSSGSDYDRSVKERNVEKANRVRELEPNYKTKYELPESEKKGGCYVATCVYGSYDCPQVWTLRRYRDETLGATWYGRLFIRIYYAVSPVLVKLFGKTSWFQKFWRGRLDKMVKNLQEKGMEDTPYNDKNW